jgi:hypothetical protein
MLTHPTYDKLIALGLTGMAKALEEQVDARPQARNAGRDADSHQQQISEWSKKNEHRASLPARPRGSTGTSHARRCV